MKKTTTLISAMLLMLAGTAQNSVFDEIAASPNHTVLTDALEQQGLDLVLDDVSNDYTVFAPDDAAFTQALSDLGLTPAQLLASPDLTKILLHHVLSGTVLSTGLSNTEVTTLSELDVTVDVTMGAMIDNANVTTPNIVADNGVVHVLDYVLLPTYDDVTEVISTSPDHTVLLQALQTAGLVSTLQNQGADFTVFAPDDAAFTQALSDLGLTPAQLLASPDLTKILLHHVLSGTVLSTGLSNTEVTTLSDLDVTVDVSMGAMIDNANVTAPDIVADNGVVHVLDYVLLPTYDDVTEVISTSPDHTVLLQALQTAGLVSTLQNQGADFTVFAPDDAAFTQALSDLGLTPAQLLASPDLTKILLHHVLSGTVLSTGLSNTEVTTLSDLDVTVDVSMGAMIDNANVTAPDIVADNGVVHVLDYVLLPTYDDVTEVISTSPDHTVLLQALQTAGLVSTLQNQGADFTVFAPDDAAFTQALSDLGLTPAQLLASPDLTKILLHHVLSGTVLSTGLSNTEVTTLSDLDVTVDVSMGAMIDNANVTAPDIVADNGVVHVLDYVLLPTYDDVTEVISTSPDHTILLQAVQAAGLVSTLQNQGADFTVFAPTDAAFTTFLTDNNLTAAQLLAAPNLDEILLHHVVSGTVLSTDLSNGPVTTVNGTDVTVDLTSGVMIDDANVTAPDVVADNGVVHVLDGVLELPISNSVEELSKIVSVYPNPTTDFININANYAGEFTIYNVEGKQVKTGSVMNNVITVNDLDRGFYFLEIEGSSPIKFLKK